jgi:hypothetical protein
MLTLEMGQAWVAALLRAGRRAVPQIPAQTAHLNAMARARVRGLGVKWAASLIA